MVRHLIPAGLHSRILCSLPAGARAPVCDIHVARHTHGNVGYDTHSMSYILCNMCNVIYFMSYSTSSQHSQGLPADLLGYQSPVCPSFIDSGALWHLVRSWAHAAAHVNHFQMTFDSCFNITAVETVATPHCLGNDDKFSIGNYLKGRKGTCCQAC